MKTWKIYKHTLVIDCPHKGWSYIGQTSKNNLNQRWKNGWGYKAKQKNGDNTAFWNAVQKYGWDSFEHTIIEANITTLEEANLREQYWISYYNTFIGNPNCHGYNMTPGGSGYSCKHTSAAKAKISQKLKGRKLSAEHKEKIGKANKGHRMSEKQKRAISTARTGKHLSAECRSKISQSNKGKHFFVMSDEQKIKLSLAAKGKPKPKKNYKIRCIETNEIFLSCIEASKKHNIHRSAICNCVNGKAKTAGGYHWERIKEAE